MSAKKAHKKKPITLMADDPEALKGSLKAIGGSQSDHWNNILANQTVKTLRLANSDEKAPMIASQLLGRPPCRNRMLQARDAQRANF